MELLQSPPPCARSKAGTGTAPRGFREERETDGLMGRGRDDGRGREGGDEEKKE